MSCYKQATVLEVTRLFRHSTRRTVRRGPCVREQAAKLSLCDEKKPYRQAPNGATLRGERDAEMSKQFTRRVKRKRRA